MLYSNELLINIYRFLGGSCRDFLDLGLSEISGFLPSGLVISEPPRANAAQALRKKPCNRYREGPGKWKTSIRRMELPTGISGFLSATAKCSQAKKSSAGDFLGFFLFTQKGTTLPSERSDWYFF
ncbi:MAG: hypothetical protein R3281_17755 [Balneolaceae bacterium]|nr:hypothetical protein [Balneolaceae bacterium]